MTETTSRVVSWYPEQSDSLIQHLIDQHEAWLDIIWREKGKVKIYVGPNENAQLLQMMWDTDFPGVVELVDAQTRIGYGGEAKVFNIPVTVVPWMDGALLVPA